MDEFPTLTKVGQERVTLQIAGLNLGKSETEVREALTAYDNAANDHNYKIVSSALIANMKAGQKLAVSTFETGAVRSADCADVRYDLVSPVGLRRLAETYAEGAVKYGDFNWEKGMPIFDLLNHVIPHVYKYLSGDRSEDHLAHAAWGLFAAMHSEELWPHLNEGNLRLEGCKPPVAPSPAKPETESDGEQPIPTVDPEHFF